jgi:hypothetical protein
MFEIMFHIYRRTLDVIYIYYPYSSEFTAVKVTDAIQPRGRPWVRYLE